ncbi:MAG: tRNA (adenosine(37)-N6)-threonylcarbamoyltransferase complex dimerization subunit type 1 TsaB [Bacillales bacterium]|nr:tRNA (adenosine(37)-N6)-threonylcarbamoyltransferase complex dimerization subunit type 1 TsaB [Bacillales bacterium]
MILFIDTSTSYPIVSIIENNNIKAMFNKKIDTDISVSIFSILDTMFKELNITPQDIKKIFIANGPGSFTGTRIGVTIAKVYGYSLNVDLIPVSTLEVLAGGVNKDYIVPVIDARRGFVYAGIYDKDLNKIVDDRYISLDKLKEKLEGKDYVFVSYDDIAGSIKPKIDLIKVINKHEKDIPVNAHGLNPNYLKKTEAEEKLSDKKNN